MGIFKLAIIVPSAVIACGRQVVQAYIIKTLSKYSTEHRVEPYLCLTRVQLEKKWEHAKKDGTLNVDKYKTIEHFCRAYCGCTLDANGNALTTCNPTTFYSFARFDHEASDLLSDDKPSETFVSAIIDQFGLKPFMTNPVIVPAVELRQQLEEKKTKGSVDPIWTIEDYASKWHQNPLDSAGNLCSKMHFGMCRNYRGDATPVPIFATNWELRNKLQALVDVSGEVYLKQDQLNLPERTRMKCLESAVWERHFIECLSKALDDFAVELEFVM